MTNIQMSNTKGNDISIKTAKLFVELLKHFYFIIIYDHTGHIDTFLS